MIGDITGICHYVAWYPGQSTCVGHAAYMGHSIYVGHWVFKGERQLLSLDLTEP